jgi:DNA-binding NtrC family response regulator
MVATQLFGVSATIRQIDDDISWAARSDAKVLLTGESGVGKEVVARLIHQRSDRCRQPMVSINCAGIPDNLLASEMFGHTRGSFTDAHRDRVGWLGQAHQGTAFLDEVGEMSVSMQALLLRSLETGEIQRVGSEGRATHVNVRTVCATNRRLLDRVKTGDFREDLYYRLNVIHIEIPPLRERREDITALFKHFIQRFSLEHGLPEPTVARETDDLLRDYAWPGNVRELRNYAERAVIRCRTREIQPTDMPLEFVQAGRIRSASIASPTVMRTRADDLFARMLQDGESFWTAVHTPFMLRDITRDDLRTVVRSGLTTTYGSYRAVVKLFNMPQTVSTP